MSIQYRSTRAIIDLNALRHNCIEAQKKLPQNCEILAIVKANAYGHGALFSARALEGANVKRFAVATIEEGIELRRGGIRKDILILDGPMVENLEVFMEHRLKPVLSCMSDVKKWIELSKHYGREYPVHLKFDTGMGRLGLLPSDVEELASLLRFNSDMKIESIMTHLARADEEDPHPTQNQIALMIQIKEHLQSRNINGFLVHFCNSAALIDGRTESSDWARPGIMLYGAYPHERHRSMIDLKPVMTLKTSILQIKKLNNGSAIGYGGTHVLSRDSRIAALPIGYADGYPRSLSNKAKVLVAGMYAPVIGRVSMDLTLIDVTDVPEAKAGDEVVLIGLQGENKITVEEVAHWAGTISYEILCGISARVPRMYEGL